MLSVEWVDTPSCSCQSSKYKLERLRLLLQNLERPRREHPWEAKDLNFPAVDFESLFEPEGVRRWLGLVEELGFAVVRGVPSRPEVTDAVGALIGVKDHREMFGEQWWVRVVAGDGNDSAFSPDEILPHTDGCYLRRQPELQLFHCFRADADGGGVTGLLDGFRVAEELRSVDPESFRVLSTQEVQFQFEDSDTRLLAWHTVLGVCPSSSALQRVTWNNLDRGALPASPELTAALRKWDELLHDDKRWEVKFSMGEKDLLLVDNCRILHARHGRLSPTSQRLLYGFYMDKDGVLGGMLKPRTLPSELRL